MSDTNPAESLPDATEMRAAPKPKKKAPPALIVVVTIVSVLVVIAAGILIYLLINREFSGKSTDASSQPQLRVNKTMTASPKPSMSEMPTIPSAQTIDPESENYITEVKNGFATTPYCDGHYILIHASVVERPGVSTATAIENALRAAPPGSTFTYPGACSSLRAQKNGANIYPIYTDYGWEKKAMCEAHEVLGGTPRTLNDDSDFSNPC